MHESPHIAIAGGGMAGLTTALALSRRGFPVTVIEQAPELQEVGAGLQISPNAWRVLDALGLGQAIMARSTAPTALRVRSARGGRTITRMPLGATAEARWKAPYRVIHRADLQATLAEALTASEQARLRLDTTIADFREKALGVTVVTGAGEATEFAGLVGADGIRSTIRQRLTGEDSLRHAGKIAWRTTIPADELPPGLEAEETVLWLGRDAHLVHYAVRDGREINVIAVTTGDWDAPGWSADGDPAELLPSFADWPAPARVLLERSSGWKKWALADRAPTRNWGKGPVTLVGDAAHPMLPFLAQGAAMAIEDGWVLAAQLADDGDVAASFRRYEARRHARTARVQRAARSNGDVYHLGGVAGRARDLALSLVGPEQLMARWDWLYGWQPPGWKG